MSRLFVAVVIAVALAGMLLLLQAMNAAEQVKAGAAGRSTAETLATALLQPAGVTSSGELSTEDVTRIRGAVDQLRGAGTLLGLGVWRLDGTPLVSALPSLPVLGGPTPADLRRARAGRSWTAPGASREQLRVFAPVLAPTGAGTPTALVEAVVPHAAVSAEARAQLLRRQGGASILFLLLIAGVLGLRWRLQRSEYQARHDPLTGLLNRRGLKEDARALLAATTSRRPVALLLFDLNEFKSVNDTLGHPAGDLLLQQVAATLRSRVRPADLIGRLGGDEFAALLTDVPDIAAAQDRADYLLTLLRAESFIVHGIELSIDVAVGVVLAPDHGVKVDDLLQRADVAMYQAKRARRGTMAYDPANDNHTVDQLTIIAELRHALENNEFVLHYQPKISLPDRGVTGVEALVRWQHPVRGLVAPGEFLPALEAGGLMVPLTRWVVREAVHQAASWQRAGVPLKVAVNISPRSLLDYDLPARVLATLSAAGLPPSLLELEVTETAVMVNPERAAYVLTQLRARGINVSIDDFGAGYTSLALLRVLPVTELKIDRSLVTNMLDVPEDEAVTTAVIDLAHRLGFQVVAEGVETEPVLARLAALGCDQAQGFLISRPLPAPSLEGWLTGQHIIHPAAALTAGGAAPPLSGLSGDARSGQGQAAPLSPYRGPCPRDLPTSQSAESAGGDLPTTIFEES